MSTARRLRSLVVGGAAVLSVVAPSHALAHGRISAPARMPAAASASDGDADDLSPTTTVLVDSGGPVPGVVNPLTGSVDEGGIDGRWWLLMFGGVQVVGLVMITRRVRGRLSTNEAQP